MRPSFRLLPIAIVACPLLVVATSINAVQSANAADWSQFLGPNRNGISEETGLIDAWPTGGPKEVWRVKGGVGMSGVAVRGNVACTLIQTGGQQRVLALNAKTGATTWSTPVATAYENGQGGHACPPQGF